MKKIVLVGQYDPFGINVGGMEIYMKNLANEFEKSGFEPIVFGWTASKQEKKNFTPIVTSDKLLGRKFSLNLLLKAPFIALPSEMPIIVDRPDRVLAFMFRRNKIICIMHGSHQKNVFIKKGFLLGYFYKFLENIALKRANRIIFVSEKDLDLYVGKYPFIKQKSLVIPVGVSAIFKPMDKSILRKKYKFDSKKKFGIYIGRLEKEKQVDMIISFFKKAKAKLIIVGRGREEKSLKHLAEGSDNITFVNTIDNNMLPELINCADFLVLFSKHEGMPTVILEALSCGKPVLSSDVGDISKVVRNNVTGFLANESDFIEKIPHISNKSKAMMQDCLDIAKDYAWGNTIKKIIDFCEL